VAKVEIRGSGYEAPVMKRLSILGLVPALVLVSLVLTPQPARATAFSADCQKVKTHVLADEAKERDFEQAYAPVNGKWSWFFSSAHLNDYWLLQKKIIDFEVVMFAYDLANLPCLTPKQQAYAKTVSKQWNDLRTFVNGQPDWIAGFSFVPIVWDSIYDKDLVSPIP
jgi:hypothetical protein